MTEYFTKDGDEYKKVDENLFSQNEIDTNIIPKRLERERAKFADYDTLKEKAGKVDTISSEFEDKLKEKDTQIGTLSSEVKSAKLETDKVKIVNEFGLSDEVSEFVTGDTPEEMRARAEKLSKNIKTKVVVKKSGKPDEKKSDSKAIAGKLFGKKSDD